MSESVGKKNAKLARTLLIIAVAMFGFGYALVPIYDVLCEWKWIERDRPDDIKKVPEVAYEVDLSRENYRRVYYHAQRVNAYGISCRKKTDKSPSG